MIKFGYTIIYVENVRETVHFFEKVFNIKKRFIHESGDYGELDTGETRLSFASHTLGKTNLPKGYMSVSTSSKPLGIEIALVASDVPDIHEKALKEGALEINPPEQKSWGQTVSYVRTPSGILLELCTPI